MWVELAEIIITMKVGQIKPLKVCQSIKNSVEKHLGDNMNIRVCFMYLKSTIARYLIAQVCDLQSQAA